MAENLKSNATTNNDSMFYISNTAGEGGPGDANVLTDYVAPTASIAQWSTYRMARFPTVAKIKRVWIYLQGGDTNGTATMTIDTNVSFSDDTADGTPVALQGTIPSNKLDGTSLAFVTNTGYSTAYANSGTGNKLFGNTAGSNNGTAQMTDITFKNTTAGQGFFPAQREVPLWSYFGFTNPTGGANDPGGEFDILFVVAAAVATAAVGVFGIELDYCV